MIVSSKVKQADRASHVSIERWTIERLDRDAGMARIETAPMLGKHVTQKLIDRLLAKGLEAGVDKLSLWDASRVKNQYISINNLSNPSLFVLMKKIHFLRIWFSGLSFAVRAKDPTVHIMQLA